ncbi:protein kinase domain-containing protein [Methylobacter sp.]|uniref:serine/threonine protein kinase n=1 Tax=Methylobacter sp. TaxID=2051955 RepID=UPI003DA49BE7
MTIQVPGYTVQKLLGEGGMASVYLATQKSLDRPVALKILKRFDTEAQIRRFFNEGKIIASLNHHNIITIHDLGEVDGRCFLAMEYIEGGDLKQRIDTGLPPDEAIQLIKLIAHCLDFVHQKGIIHRDIKPENILFRKNGTPVLTDFGVAKQLQTDTSLTMDGSAIGSPHYLSPEQAEQKPLDARTDIYSLGIILYEMLTGQKPFQGDSPIEIIIAHLTTEAPPLPKSLAKYQELLDLMIARDANDRFDSAADLVDYLGRLQKPASSHVLGKKIGKIISSTEKKTKAPVKSPLSTNQTIKPGKSLYKPVLFGVTSAAILSAAIYFYPYLNTKPAPQENSSADSVQDSVRDKSTATETASALLDNSRIQQLLAQAKTLLDNPNTSLPILKQAYDAYNLVLKMDPDNAVASQGITHVGALYATMQDKVDFYLSEARKALQNYRLTSPSRHNALFYFHEVLLLDPNNAEAQQGKFKIANAYADLAESNLDAFDYTAAKANIKKGLSIYPNSSRLLALRKKTNAFTDAPKRLFGKIRSIFN